MHGWLEHAEQQQMKMCFVVAAEQLLRHDISFEMLI